MKYYKVLDKKGYSCNGGYAKWSLPTQNEDGSWTPGEWMPPVDGILEPCVNGYHIITIEKLVHWLGDRIFEVEVGKEIVHDDNKSHLFVVRTCRLVRECIGWNERTARIFAADCAERVLPIYELIYHDTNKLKHAIETARLYADGRATCSELLDAGTAARIAAANASTDAINAYVDENTTILDAKGNSVPFGAAADAASLAAWAAAETTKWDVKSAVTQSAGAAADAAALNAWVAAETSKWDATEDDARAAWVAAETAERKWQAERLREILEEVE